MEKYQNRLKELRLEKGIMGVHELSRIMTERHTPVSYGALDRMEKFNTPVERLKTILGLAEFFDVSIDYLLGRSDHREI